MSTDQTIKALEESKTDQIIKALEESQKIISRSIKYLKILDKYPENFKKDMGNLRRELIKEVICHFEIAVFKRRFE